MRHLDIEHAKKYRLLEAAKRDELEKNNPRLQVTQKEDISYSSSDFISILKKAKEFAKKWKKTINDVNLKHSCYQYDYCDNWSSEVHLEVQGLETDDQYHARLMERYESISIRNEYERKEFERLKAKFES